MGEVSNIFDRLRIRPEVADMLGYYVYAYVDPRDLTIFYVGKGCGARALAHLDEAGESAKNSRIAELKRAGLTPRIDILAHGIADEVTALRIEAAVIDALWPGKTLTNKVRGNQTVRLGRTTLNELEFQYSAKPIEIVEPVILIRINQLYRPGMSADELYEVTRGVWKCGIRRKHARYALAVFKGVVREAYEIRSWHPAGTLAYRTREVTTNKSRRWEFDGIVSGELSTKYVGGLVERHFSRGAQTPFTYLNC